MSWSAYITGEGGLIAQYDKIACGGIFGQNGSTFAQAQECRLAFFFSKPRLRVGSKLIKGKSSLRNFSAWVTF